MAEKRIQAIFNASLFIYILVHKVEKLHFIFTSTMEHHPWGGSEYLWSESSKWLANNGHSVSASVPYWSSPRTHLDNVSKSGVRLQQRKISLRDFYDYGMAKLTRKPGKRPPGFGRFVRWIQYSKPDLVCFSHGGVAGNPMMMKACYNLGIPYVSLGQANTVGLWPKDDQLEEVRFALLNAKKVFFVSKENLELTEYQIGTSLPHAEVVWNPFNVGYDADPPWPVCTNKGFLNLACVARLETNAKGQDLLFRVLGMDKWRKRSLQVTIYGKGPNLNSLTAMVEMLDLQKQVMFAGHVDNVEKIWAENHGLILPSRYEGLPLALVEAMLCNRVAIVTNVSGNPEVVVNNITGFLADAPTVEHLDAAMEMAWERRDEWEVMGKKAGEHIRSLIPEDPAAEFAEKLLEIAISNK